MNYGKARDENEREIVAALRSIGASVHRLHEPCDLLVGYRGFNYLLEVKTTRGKLTANQKQFDAEWRGHFAIVRTSIEALRAIGAISPTNQPYRH